MAQCRVAPAGSAETPEQIFERAKVREIGLSRLLVFFISGGLLFMLLPGTFLGVWSLISISGRHAADSISPAWIQAHGHAQIFGWIGSFILGIGFHSLPKLRRTPQTFSMASAWGTGIAWMTGVLLRWFANVYLWHWRILLPISAALELAAFLVFFRAVSQHKSAEAGKGRLGRWILVVIAGTIGLLATLLLNFAGGLWVAWRGSSPAFPQNFNQRLLLLAAWGFMVPFVWGFSAKWLPTFLGIADPNERILSAAVAVQITAVIVGLFGWVRLATLLLLLACALTAASLHVFAPSQRPAKTKGVHTSFPLFLRAAYAWLFVAAGLAIWAAFSSNSTGIWGASRHALTVGFIATMVFCVGQRVLPAFSGMRLLFSSRLMFAALLLLTLGCALRVASEVLAYQQIAPAAWHWLPISAVIELTAVTLFALNLAASFMQTPPSARLLTISLKPVA